MDNSLWPGFVPGSTAFPGDAEEAAEGLDAIDDATPFPDAAASDEESS